MKLLFLAAAAILQSIHSAPAPGLLPKKEGKLQKLPTTANSNHKELKHAGPGFIPLGNATICRKFKSKETCPEEFKFPCWQMPLCGKNEKSCRAVYSELCKMIALTVCVPPMAFVIPKAMQNTINQRPVCPGYD